MEEQMMSQVEQTERDKKFAKTMVNVFQVMRDAVESGEDAKKMFDWGKSRWEKAETERVGS